MKSRQNLYNFQQNSLKIVHKVKIYNFQNIRKKTWKEIYTTLDLVIRVNTQHQISFQEKKKW